MVNMWQRSLWNGGKTLAFMSFGISAGAGYPVIRLKASISSPGVDLGYALDVGTLQSKQ